MWDRAEWRGVSAMTTKELDAALGLKPGDVADVTKIETGLRQVRGAYRHRLHAAAIDDDAQT
jgi:Surface antigen variable number repeat